MALDESDGVFAKRRRNLLASGITIMVIAVGNPDLENISVFGVDFNFDGKFGLVLIGLSFWYIYTLVRVMSYYITYIRDKNFEEKRFFIYYDDVGKNYWKSQYESNMKKINVVFRKKYTSQGEIHEIDESSNHLEHVRAGVRDGRIPGVVHFPIYVRFVDGRLETIKITDEPLTFKVEGPYKWHIFKRRIDYLMHDHWWEYSFIFFFIVASVIALMYSWLTIR